MAEQSSGNLSHSVLMSSDVLVDICCDVCSEDGKQVEAEGFCVECVDYLCGECYKGHMKNRLSRSHQLLDKKTMPRKKPSAAATSNLSNDQCTEPCQKHRDRTAEYYCKDHKQLGCSVCMTVNHRTCKDVDHIPDLTQDLLQSQEYKQFEKTTERLKNRTVQVLEVCKENVTRSEQCSLNAVQRVLSLQNDTNVLFDSLVDRVKKQTKSLKSDDLERLKTVTEAGNKVIDDTEKIASKTHDLKKTNKLCKLFTHMQKTQNELKNLNEALDKTQSSNTVTTYLFETSTELKRMLDGSVSIGEINARSPVEVSIPAISKDLNQVSAIWKKDISVNTTSDNMTCLISGIAVLPDNKLILADRDNRTVKLADIGATKVTSELKLQTGPWDLTLITRTEAAVTLPNSKEIVVVKIASDLTTDRRMKVSGECRGITYCRGKLIVTFVEPTSRVIIMSLDAIVEKQIDVVDARWLSHATCNPDSQSIYCSDLSLSTGVIVHITLDGTKKFYRNTDLKSPRGITVDQLGRVLVCGQYSGTVVLLDPALGTFKSLINNLDRPTGLSYCQRTNTLYVGFENNDNVIKVYQLS